MSRTVELNRYRDKLHALREQLDAHASQQGDDVSDVVDSGERANQQTEFAVNIGLATHDAAIRKEIDDALGRIDAGTFAQCGNCHAVIGTRRLSAIPYARFCVRCERRIEQEGTTEVDLGA